MAQLLDVFNTTFDKLKHKEEFWYEYEKCNKACGTIPGLRKIVTSYLPAKEITALRKTRKALEEKEIKENRLLELCDNTLNYALPMIEYMIKDKEGLGAIPELVSRLLDYNDKCFGFQHWYGVSNVYDVIINLDDLLAKYGLDYIPWINVLHNLYYQDVDYINNFQKMTILLNLLEHAHVKRGLDLAKSWNSIFGTGENKETKELGRPSSEMENMISFILHSYRDERDNLLILELAFAPDHFLELLKNIDGSNLEPYQRKRYYRLVTDIYDLLNTFKDSPEIINFNPDNREEEMKRLEYVRVNMEAMNDEARAYLEEVEEEDDEDEGDESGEDEEDEDEEEY